MEIKYASSSCFLEGDDGFDVMMNLVSKVAKHRKRTSIKGYMNMKIASESNYILLGSEDIDSMDFESQAITIKELLVTVSDRSANSVEFLSRDGSDLAIDVEIEINGRSLALCSDSVNTVLRDGDRVGIRLMPTGGG